MGGNKKGKINTYKFLIITMVLGGLWHGASWLFVIWGLLHGLLLAIERLAFGKIQKRSLVYSCLVFLFVCIAWIFFRSNDVVSAIEIVKACFFYNGIESLSLEHPFMGMKLLPEFISFIPLKHVAFIFLGLLVVFLIPNTNVLIEKYKIYNTRRWSILIFLIFVIDFLFCFQNSPFIYFQF